MLKFVSIFSIVLISNSIFSQPLFETEPNVRVRIINTMDSLDVMFNGIWTLNDSIKIDGDGKTANIIIKNDKITITSIDMPILNSNELNLKSLNSGSIIISDVPYGVGWWWEGKEDRVYEGEISIYKSERKKLEVVIKLPLEEYLKGVIPYEIGGDSPLESLKAQAVAARSEAVVALQSDLYSGLHHDLTSDVECQVFSGNNKRTKTSDRAVEESRGIILSENGKPINAFYASNCGGHSELIKNVWPRRSSSETYQVAFSDNEEHDMLDLGNENAITKWINSNPNVYCNPNLETELPRWSKKNFRWEKEFSIIEISEMVQKDKGLGNLLEINAINRGASGRIYKAEFVFEKNKIITNGELQIRQLFSPSLRSSAFIIEKTDSTFILKGAGWGHGVGMCQSGAVSQANHGKDYKSILHHYYSKAKLFNLYLEEG